MLRVFADSPVSKDSASASISSQPSKIREITPLYSEQSQKLSTEKDSHHHHHESDHSCHEMKEEELEEDALIAYRGSRLPFTPFYCSSSSSASPAFSCRQTIDEVIFVVHCKANKILQQDIQSTSISIQFEVVGVESTSITFSQPHLASPIDPAKSEIDLGADNVVVRLRKHLARNWESLSINEAPTNHGVSKDLLY